MTPDPASVAAEEALSAVRAEIARWARDGHSIPVLYVRQMVDRLEAAWSGPASPGGLDVERLRDEIAASVWGAAHSQIEFACTCDHDASCWPHEEADAVIDAAHLTKEATR
jgi:hypothetical protein